MEKLLELDPTILILVFTQFTILIIAIIFLVLNRLEITRLKEKYSSFVEYLGDGESKDILQECVDMIRNIEYENRLKDKEISEILEILSSCIQKVAIIRYNAFSNVGSDLSYAVALLDHEDNGVVLSSLYGRDSTTTYAKPINAGNSQYVLTEEEENAISLARKKFIDKSYYSAKMKLQDNSEEVF